MKIFYTLSIIVSLINTAYAACPTAPGRFVPVASSPNEVLDTKTKLVWARCSVGQTWSGTTCTGTATGMTHEAALTHATTHTGWRLPNVKELASLADKGCRNPAIDVSVFPNTVSNPYWTLSPYVGLSNDAGFVNFNNGSVNYSSYRSNLYYVRLVRASQ